jgi:hypothetical protein
LLKNAKEKIENVVNSIVQAIQTIKNLKENFNRLVSAILEITKLLGINKGKLEQE